MAIASTFTDTRTGVGAQQGSDWAITVDSATDLLVCSVAALESDSTPSALTLDGAALTQLFEVKQSSRLLQVWYLVNPSTGAQTISRTQTTGHTTCVDGVQGFSGVDSSTPFDSVVTASAFNASPTVNIVSDEDDLVIDVIAVNTASLLTVHSTQTEQYQDLDSNTHGASSMETGGGTVTMSWEAFPGSEHWALGGVAINPDTATSSQTTRDLGETFTFSDDLARDFWGDRLGADIRDVFTFSDSMVADLILIRELNDTVATFADQLNKDAIYIRTPQDTVSFTDSIVRDLDLVRELQDTATFSDVLDALLINIRELQDSFTFNDALARDQDLVRLVQDTLVLVENLDRTNTGDTTTVSDHHRFKLWQNLRRWRLYKPRDQIH